MNTIIVAVEGSSELQHRAKSTAWDAADNNTNIFGVHSRVHNLFEDLPSLAGASRAKSFQLLKRETTLPSGAPGDAGKALTTGPKMTYQIIYDNHNMTCENCIGTWSGERMEANLHALQGYDAEGRLLAAVQTLEITFTNYGVDHPYESYSGGDLKDTQSKILGSIAYVRGSDRSAGTSHPCE
jgi:hypothetical protein